MSENGPLTCGPKIEELEDKLCRITGARHAVSVCNGTAALHIACLAAGVGEGDEVITTPYYLCRIRKLCAVLRGQTGICGYQRKNL